MSRFGASRDIARRQARRPSRRLGRLGLALLATATAAASTTARADPPLWRVVGPHAEVDLFGSIHLLSDATRWRTPALDAEIAKAGAIWFEIPLGGAAQADAVQMMRVKGLLPPGQTLSGQLPATLYARVLAQAKREGLDAAALDRARPWLAELELTLVFYQHQGYSEKLGVESQIDAAVPASVPRQAFETLAEQVTLFADDPMPEQVASLKETLDEIDIDPGIFARIADAWRRGDVKAMEAELIDPMRKDDAALYRRLLVDRNRRFAARIEQLARGRGRVLVVVGAGHLVGPDGVPAMLRRDGLEVQGP